MIGRYEIGFIVAAESSEDEQKKIVDNLTGIIKKGDGKIEQVDEWGLRKLSFPIQKNTDGFYVFIQCEAEGSLVTAVERRLRQIEKVLRFITLRLDDKLKKSNKLTKKWRKTTR